MPLSIDYDGRQTHKIGPQPHFSIRLNGTNQICLFHVCHFCREEMIYLFKLTNVLMYLSIDYDVRQTHKIRTQPWNEPNRFSACRLLLPAKK